MEETIIRKLIELNNILAEWDPIGVGSHDSRYPYSEYIFYIKPIIEEFEKQKTIYPFLLELNNSLSRRLDKHSDIGEVASKIETVLKS